MELSGYTVYATDSLEGLTHQPEETTMSDNNEWILTMHHAQTMLAAQYVFKKEDFARAAYEAVVKSKLSGKNSALIEHFSGTSLVDAWEFCEITVGPWKEHMAQFGFMQESTQIAGISAEVRAQQATRHLARFQAPQAR